MASEVENCAEGDVSKSVSLVARLRCGDPLAEVAFYRRHLPFVRTQLVKLLGEGEELDDVIQEVFASVFDALRRNGMPRSLHAWLRTVARNHAFRHLATGPEATPCGPEEIERLADTEGQLVPDPYEELLARRGTADLTALLPAKQRRALFLRYDLDLDWESVGEKLGISSGAARILHHRAINALRERMQGPPSGNGRRDEYPVLRIWAASSVIRARKQAACWTL